MADSDRYLAVEDNELCDFAVGLMDYSDQLGDLFSKIDFKMNELMKYFGGKAANDLFAQYNVFKQNYPIVRDNVISYSDDIITYITRLHEGDNAIATSLNNASEEVSRIANSIESL